MRISLRELNRCILFLLISYSTCTLAAQDISDLLTWDQSEGVIGIEKGIEIEPNIISYKDHVITLENTSKEDITISEVTSDCACLKIEAIPKEMKPLEKWSFKISLIRHKYQKPEKISLLVKTDKGDKILKLEFLGALFTQFSTQALHWKKGETNSKSVDLEMGSESIILTDMRVLGGGFESELIKDSPKKSTIKLTPINGGFEKGLLKFKTSGAQHSEEHTIRLTREKE